MKKSIFKKAWILFKRYQITFSQALIKAWNDYKRNLLVTAYNKIPSKAQYSKKKNEAKLAIKNFLEVDFLCVSRNIANTDGASIWYDGKTFNAD